MLLQRLQRGLTVGGGWGGGGGHSADSGNKLRRFFLLFFCHTLLPTQFIDLQRLCNRNVLRGAKRDDQGSFITFLLLLFSFFYVAFSRGHIS